MGKALVTGGAGFIGSHLVDRLISDGWTVTILDNFSSSRVENVKHHEGNLDVKIFNADLKKPDEIIDVVRDVDVVFHYAANPEVRVSTVNPEIHFSENVMATFNLLEAVRRADIGELVFASSSSVYGEPESIPVDENAPIRPVSVYGASKASCESLIHAYSRLYGVRAVALRYANVVGPRLRHGVVYDFIVKLLKRPDTLEVLGDGTQTRSYIYVGDAVEATFTAWMSMHSGFEVYNVGSGDWLTVNEVAEAIVGVMGLENVKYVYKPVLHGVGWLGDVKQIALSIDRLRGLGWKPRLKSREAVAKAAIGILSELQG